MLKFWCSFGFLPNPYWKSIQVLAQDSNKSSTQLCSGNQWLTCSLSFLVMTPRINPSRRVIKLDPSRLAGTHLPQVFQKASLPTGQLYQPFRSLSVLWPRKTKRLCTSKPSAKCHFINFWNWMPIGCNAIPQAPATQRGLLTRTYSKSSQQRTLKPITRFTVRWERLGSPTTSNKIWEDKTRLPSHVCQVPLVHLSNKSASASE